MQRKFAVLVFVLTVAAVAFSFGQNNKVDDSQFVQYVADYKTHSIKLYWKDEQGKLLSSIERLKNWLAAKKQTLLFAMNGGMYQEDRRPVGLYIEGGKVLAPLNKRNAGGNFYIKPNGVFYISTDTHAGISTTEQFSSKQVFYTTQSGPMLVVNNIIPKAFTKGSANRNIRNGVGILPNGNAVFVLSKEPVNFYDFADYFKRLGCKNALYLDRYVSRMYAPEKQWTQTDGNFGVMIGISANTSR